MAAGAVLYSKKSTFAFYSALLDTFDVHFLPLIRALRNTEALMGDDKVNWKFVPAQDVRPAYYLYDSEVQKSHNDDREYRVIRLENGLEAVVVHDATADKAAASMNVAVGSFNDPDDIPGLAHFCEHLMFMGTKQFPKENEYSEYLSRNNGYCNAFTGGNDTAYFFSVASGALGGALERFSDFFHSPLFSESCTMREVNAVDSEFSMYLQDDDWRLGQVIRHHARLGHPLRKFIVGNKKTLAHAAHPAKSRNEKGAIEARTPYDTQSKGTRASRASSHRKEETKEEIRDKEAGLRTRRRLLEWWSKEYGAERMHLAVIGKESLDDLTDIVTTLFSPIKNHGQDPLPHLPERPFEKEQLGTFLYVKTITDINNVTMTSLIPYQAPFWRVKPADFLAHLIGHEGPGSLHAYLKNKGWLSALEASTDDLGRGVTSFQLSLDLTKDGLKNYREVIQICFKYINLLRDSELPKWIQEEIITLQALEFRFDEKLSADHYASHISSFMQLPIPRALLLSGHRLTWGWDEQLVREMLSELVIENSFIIVASQDHGIVGKTGPWSREPWFGTHFMAERIDRELINAAQTLSDISDLSLPKPNEFIPANVEVEKVDVPRPKKRPALIKRNDLIELWFKKDDQFWTPRAQFLIEARTPIAGSRAQNLVMTRLFACLVEDSLTEYSYDAELAGLSYDFSASIHGFTLGVGGYNDKLHVLAQDVMEKVKNLDFLEDRLEVMKEEAEQELSNMLLGDPYLLSEYYLSYLLLDREFTVEEQLAEIPGVTVNKLREHVKHLLSQLKYKILVNGNLRKGDALHLAGKLDEVLGAEALPAKKVVPNCSRILPDSCNYIWELPIPNPDEANSSVSYYCHVGRISDPRVRVMCSILDKILQEPAFDLLRTKEQLGYTIMCSTWENIESIGWRIFIQSEKDPRYLESRIEAFLVLMRSILEKMGDQEFEDQKAALIHEWTEKLKTLMEESARFWDQIKTGYLDFKRFERDAGLVKSVNKTHIIDMFDRFLNPSSPTRSKLSVHMRTQNPITPKLSEHAAEKFLAALRKVGVTTDEEEYASLCEEMPAMQARGYWEEALHEQLGNSHKAEKILTEFDRLVENYPQKGYVPVELDPKVIFIKDGAEFRQSLTLSASAKPVETFDVE